MTHDCDRSTLKRREDPKLLVGEAKYVDDIQVPGQLWMGMVRSPMAHAKIASIDTSEAETHEGVHAVYTGPQLQEMGLWIAPLPCAWPVTDDMVNPPHYPLAMDEVHHVGEIVAIVLADSRYGAVDAAELVVVDYEPLDAVASIATARDGSTMAHSDLDSNKSFHWPLVPDPDALEAAFANATHTIEAEFVQQRLIPAAMEPRGVLAVPSPMGGDVTLYSATQVPYILKVMAAATTGIPESKIRVIAPSVGGGFGAKLNINPDEILAISLANKLGRAVRWTESRTEAAFSTHQGRGQLQKIELAADADGKLMGCRVHIDADMGAYMMLITPGVPLLGASSTPACTTCLRSDSPATATSPTSPRPMPIVAPVGPRRATRSSGRWTFSPPRSASAPTRSAAATTSVVVTTSRISRCRRRSCSTPATTAPTSTRHSNSPATRISRPSRRAVARRVSPSSSVSAWLPTSRSAVSPQVVRSEA